MQPLVTVSRNADDIVLAVAGDVDLAVSPRLDAAISNAVAQADKHRIVVDLSAVRFLDSSGISSLLRGRRDADAAGVGFRVSGANGIVRQVLELTGVWEFLTEATPSA